MNFHDSIGYSLNKNAFPFGSEADNFNFKLSQFKPVFQNVWTSEQVRMLPVKLGNPEMLNAEHLSFTDPYKKLSEGSISKYCILVLLNFIENKQKNIRKSKQV